jgi:hypothetical protein
MAASRGQGNPCLGHAAARSLDCGTLRGVRRGGSVVERAFARPIAVVTFVAVFLAGCAGGPPTSAVPVTPPEGVAINPSTSPSRVLSPAVTPIPGCLPDCVPGQITNPGDLPKGDYTTRNFFGGQFTVTVPDGWTSGEDSTGEFSLRPREVEEWAVFFWLDVYPIASLARDRVPGIPNTAGGLLDWLEANDSLDILARRPGSIGRLDAEVLDFRVARDAPTGDPECSAEHRLPCVPLLDFPQWDGFYEVSPAFGLRLVAADATWGGRQHVLIAMIEAIGEQRFDELEVMAMPLVEGARLPAGVGP